MTSLDKFYMPIEIAGSAIEGEHKAYKMDSTDTNHDMRKMVGLGTCHCCDYFLPAEDSITLIEETRLLEKMENVREKYNYLNDEDRDKAVNDSIRKRMQLKAYGTMLILCRLAVKCSSAKDLIQNKKYHFWLVVSNITSADEQIYFDNTKDTLRGDLKQVLGKGLLDEVEVISSDDLKNKLSVQ